MLSKAKTLKGYRLGSLDGDIGKVKEFYFDDLHWTVRYLVAGTGNWLTGRQVLISPYALAAVNVEQQSIGVNLTKKTDRGQSILVQRQACLPPIRGGYYGYYGWQTYWNGPYVWGSSHHPVPDCEKWEKSLKGTKKEDLHLRSTQDVSGHHIQAADGEIGHVEDFIIDDKTWAIRYLVIDTQNWCRGKRSWFPKVDRAR